MNRQAEVWMDGQRAGRLSEGEGGYAFRYDPDYLAQPAGRPVSLSLPLRAEPYVDKRMIPFFDGLIPEGWLLDIAGRTWKLNPRDRMGLLLTCCRHCIGAVSIVPVAEAGS